MASNSEWEHFANELGFEGADREAFAENIKEWADDFKSFDDEVRRSEGVTEEDLAIRINVRDYD